MKKPEKKTDTPVVAKTKASGTGTQGIKLPEVEQAPPADMPWGAKLFLISLLVACFAGMAYMPVRFHRRLYGLDLDLVSIGLNNCAKIEGPIYCEEAHVSRPTGLVFLSCDPFRPVWDPILGFVNSSQVKGNGEVWYMDLNEDIVNPRLLPLPSTFTAPFHPFGLTIAPTNSSESLTSLKLLIVNRPPPPMVATVEIFTFDLTSRSLIHTRTLHSPLFSRANRLAAEANQWSADMTPSFYFTIDHAYEVGTLMRQLEDFFTIPVGKVGFYSAIGDRAQNVIWRLQSPSGVYADLGDGKGKTVFVTDPLGGKIEKYRASVTQWDAQTEEIFNEYTGRYETVFWPDMIAQDNSYEAIGVPMGIEVDYFPPRESLTLLREPGFVGAQREDFIVSIAKYGVFLDYARALHNTFPGREVDVPKPPTYVQRIMQIRIHDKNRTEISEEAKGSLMNTHTEAWNVEFVVDVEGEKFAGATAIGVWGRGGKIVLVGRYEKGALVCKI